MKANPAHSTGTGRKKRASTLPGSGISAAEKVRRMSPLKNLTSLVTKEQRNSRTQSSLYFEYAYENLATVVDARKKLESLPTSTLMRLSEAYSPGDNGVGLADIISGVLDNVTWKRTFKRHIEGVLLDVAVLHHALPKEPNFMFGYSSIITDSTALVFSTLYEVTGYVPGTLAGLSGQQKAAIEALLLVISKDGKFSGHTFTDKFIVIDYFRLPEAPKKREFPKELATRIMDNPDCSETLAEYMNKNTLHAADVKWDDFMEYLNIAAPLREGAL